MRTPEQAEQFKKDYLAQIDVKSLNKIEKVLYTYAASRALSNTSPWASTWPWKNILSIP